MLGLTNDGQLRYGPGIDMQFDDFNTSQSNLWVKLKEMFGITPKLETLINLEAK